MPDDRAGHRRGQVLPGRVRGGFRIRRGCCRNGVRRRVQGQGTAWPWAFGPRYPKCAANCVGGCFGEIGPTPNPGRGLRFLDRWVLIRHWAHPHHHAAVFGPRPDGLNKDGRRHRGIVSPKRRMMSGKCPPNAPGNRPPKGLRSSPTANRRRRLLGRPPLKGEVARRARSRRDARRRRRGSPRRGRSPAVHL